LNTAFCPESLSVSDPNDVNGDHYDEFDVTTLISPDFSAAAGEQVSFMWSFLNGETPQGGLHDTFEAMLTPIPPTAGTPIQVLAYTAGDPDGYTGTFPFLNPNSFVSHTYEVVTRPAGGPADCFYISQGNSLGQRPFEVSSTTIPPGGTGTWRLSFYFGDDGGDAGIDSGVLIDAVRVMTPPAPAGLCEAQPRTNCVNPIRYGAGRLSIREKVADATKNRLSWSWTKGPASIDLGDPVTTTTYDLCVYDAYGLIMQMSAPADNSAGTCAGNPCWSSNATTYKYKDPDGTPNGIIRMTLKSGVADTQSSIRVKGKGTHMPMPTLPLVLPVTVQLVNNDGSPGTCYSNLFSKANGNATKFVGKSE
jgi:hypothetical protein